VTGLFPPARRPRPVKGASRTKNEPRGGGHAFERDEDAGTDFFGHEFCRCGLPGEVGDARHPVDAPPLQSLLWPQVPGDDVSDRILGESNDQQGDAA